MASTLVLGFFSALLVASGSTQQAPVTGEGPLTLEWPFISAASLEEDYERYPYPQSPKTGRDVVQWSLASKVPSTGRNYTIHVGSLSCGLPGTFSFQLPEGGCCHRAQVSETSKSKGCQYATNAGFFDTSNGCCVGNLIIDSSVKALNATNRVNFGLTNGSYLLGYMKNSSIPDMKFLHMISGAGWLVRKGKSYINTSMTTEGLREKFVTEKAPRTAVVVHKNGTLSLMQVDGEEDIAAGLDLLEFSELLVQFGAWHAINLDGGGSSDSVFKDKVISKPTCIDTKIICERPVSSIACMKP